MHTLHMLTWSERQVPIVCRLVPVSLILVLACSAAEAAKCRGPIPRTDIVYSEMFSQINKPDIKSITLIYKVESVMEICEVVTVTGRQCQYQGRSRSLIREIDILQPDDSKVLLAHKVVAVPSAQMVSDNQDCNDSINSGKWAAVHRQSTGNRGTWATFIRNDAAEVVQALRLIGVANYPFPKP
jgi:hypothetical protein